MTDRISADDAAEAIWLFLDRCGANAVTKPTILAATGLTSGQFLNGLERLKDVWQEQRRQPIAITRDNRYVLTDHLDEWVGYALFALRGLRTRTDRANRGVAAAVDKWDPVNGPLLRKQMNRLVEDLDDVITRLVNVADVAA